MQMIHMSYAKFLEAVESIHHQNIYINIDPNEERLLNYIFLKYSRAEYLQVSHVLMLGKFGSQVTLHRRLNSLIAKEYIQLETDFDDARRKFLKLTPQALQRYESLAIAMTQSLKKTLKS